MAADKVKEDVELDEMEDEEEVGEKSSKRSLPGSINAYQNFLEMMQVRRHPIWLHFMAINCGLF